METEIVTRGWIRDPSGAAYAVNVFTFKDGRQMTEEEFNEYYKANNNNDHAIIII